MECNIYINIFNTINNNKKIFKKRVGTEER